MFRASELSGSALRRLVSRSPAYNVEETDVRRGIYVYVRGVPATYACLLLHGRLQIASGAEALPSELGPWILLGAAALTDASFAPEFTAQVMTAARVFMNDGGMRSVHSCPGRLGNGVPPGGDGHRGHIVVLA